MGAITRTYTRIHSTYLSPLHLLPSVNHMDLAMIIEHKFFQFLHMLSIVILFSLGHTLGHLSEVEITSRMRCLEKERRALLKFKDELVDEYGRLSSWGNEENRMDCCKWRGVHCDNRSNHVTGLNLGGPSRNGFRPSAPLKGSLSKLQYLNLSHAYFRGSIPHQFGNLSKLQYLDLRQTYQPYTCYSENLDWLSHLRSLEYLDLSSVSLSNATNWLEAISKLASIKEIHLRDCYPPEINPSSLPLINASTHLAILDFSRNGFTRNDIFPSTFRWLLNFSSSLTSIDLSANDLSGPIPGAFRNILFLSHLDLSDSYLEGGIPKYFGNMSSLIHLNLLSNRITGQLSEVVMNLSGPTQNKLQYLDLSRNRISGPIPNISRFPFLTELRLGHNQLNGSVPDGYLQLPYLVVLDLSSNQLTDLVPRLSFSLSLKQLYLNNNFFNGTLTESIGRLSQLEILCLGSNHLEGTITEAMLNLPQLRVLDLPSNSFVINCSPLWLPHFQLKYISLAHCKIGPHFPKWLQTQKELVYLDLSHTKISDTIPPWFGNISRKLVHLNASNNQIYGVVPVISFSTFNFSSNSPAPLPSDGIRLDLSRNQISGSVTFLCHVRYWSLLDLSDNMFLGQLPNCFTNFDRLRYINLANNHFSGKIPDSFGSLHALSLLQLRNNSFSGGIPTSMKKCTNLGMIDLGQNMLTGIIPSWIGDSISNLVVLSLSSNQFNGSMPSSICRLTGIQILDLSSNKISGVIPKCLYNLTVMSAKVSRPTLLLFVSSAGWDLASLTDGIAPQRSSLASANLMWKGNEVKYMNNLGLVKLIDFSSNNLLGEIPSEMTKLIGFVGLNLSGNNLVGHIPENIGWLELLNFLDLSRNRLTGGIPTSLSRLGHLGVLNLSYNNLSGRIPFTTQILTFDESAYTGNLGLCGHPSLKPCPGDETNNQDPKFSGDNNLDDKLITQGFYIAMGLGFPFGFWGIVGTILLNKRLRLDFFQGG
ncbi:hypothetical protein Pfo_022526 [Paulownia fortunei]|nr:hypothetical protein Pfo_022526 [Paulownia fortunei]